MRTAHVLQHIPLEGSGQLGVLASEAGYRVIDYPLYRGPVPADIPAGDLLIVMGGPMGVGDLDDPRWPFLRPEVEILAHALRQGRAVIGVCLGAQLMAHALGARVAPLCAGDPPVRLREVGWGAVTFDPEARADRALAGLQGSEVVVHWHGDTFDLPPGAVRLASTLLCENQMFRYGPCAYALQFHVELTPEDLPEWVRQDADFVRAAGGPQAAARILADTPRHAPFYRQMGERMMRNLLSVALDCGS